jgi:hypothetical protein
VKTDANEGSRNSKIFPLSGIMFPFYIPFRGASACRRMPAWGVGVLPNYSGSCSGAHPTVGWALALLANELLAAALLMAELILSRREGRLLSSNRLATLCCGVMIDEPH